MEIIKSAIDTLNDFNTVSVIVRILLSAVVGGIIGSERGRHGSAAGMRTHILVCLGSTVTALTGIYLTAVLGVSGDAGRISAQVISGIGFLGAGMILVKNTTVIIGLTTAAGMWATAAMGIALGYGFYLGALFAMFICVFTATFLHRMERSVKKSSCIYVEISDSTHSGDIVEEIRKITENDASIEIVPTKSGISGNVGIYIAVAVSSDDALTQIRRGIEAVDGVGFAIAE